MQITINDDMIQRLGIADGNQYNPVPFEAFDTVDFGAASAALATSYALFDDAVTKGSQYRNFTFKSNKYAVVVTSIQFRHNAAFTAMASGTTDVKLIQQYFEDYSSISFGFDEKMIFQPRVSNLLPYTRVAENGTIITTEKENDWYDLPFPLEIEPGQVGAAILTPAVGLTLSAGGASNASTGVLVNYPNHLIAGGSNNASNYRFSGIFQMKGIRFVKR